MKGKSNGRSRKKPYSKKGNRNRQENRESRFPSEREDGGKEYQRGGANDISWYSKYPELLAAAGQIPYPYRPGMSLPMGTVSNGTDQVPYSLQIPGMIIIPWVPSIGRSIEQTSPASIACKELYARVRSAFSGTIDADPPDFMIYLLALDSIFSYISSLKRVYRLLNAYTPQNYQLPEALVTKLTSSTSSTFTLMQKNKMQFYGIINELIHMTEKFLCPAVMDVFNRHYWMSDNVYTDAASANAQLYAFRQEYFYQYALQETPQGVQAGGLKLVKKPSIANNDPIGSLFNFGRTLINALAASDDAYTISGYMRRAFEGVPNFAVDLLNYDEQLELQYSEEVLTQIENILALPDYTEALTAIDSGAWNVSQDPTTNIIYAQPTVTYAASSTSQWYMAMENVTPLINVRNDMPTVADSVIATRLKSWLVPVSGSTTQYDVYSGTECVLGLLISDSGNTGSTVFELYTSQYKSLATSTAVGQSGLLDMMLLASFDWAPIMYASVLNNTTVSARIMWDIHNVTPVSMESLKELNRVCVYSEFNAFNI